ncbi:MAG: hypothetical protein QOC92_4109 [Acidimicrobiaceae bacterium]
MGFEGSVDRARGQCALVFGDLDRAVGLFEAAIALEDGFGAPVLAARTRWWMAKTLLERRASGDRERATDLLTDCEQFTESVGMRLLHQQALDLLAS